MYGTMITKKTMAIIVLEKIYIMKVEICVLDKIYIIHLKKTMITNIIVALTPKKVV